MHELVGFGQGKGEAGPVIGRRSADLGRDWTTDGDLATELLELFETSAAATLGELRAALEAGDGAEVRRIAHRLKGGARNVGATGMAELAAELEQVPPDADAALGRFEAALPPTCARLREALAD